MNRSRRVGAVRIIGLLALVWAVLPFGHAARAADATLKIEKQGWFWRHAVQVVVDPLAELERLGVTVPCPLPRPAPNLPCPSVPQRPNPFEDDHLLVGRFNSVPSETERDQAVTLLLFDVTWLEPGTTVQSATIELEESNDDFTGAPGPNNPTNLGIGHPNRRPSGNINSASGSIRACPVFEFWGGSQPTIPSLWPERPKYDCKVSAPGKRTLVDREGRTVPVWTFDIASIAKLWAEDPFGAQGLALVPGPNAPEDFMVSFHGNTYVIERDIVTGQDVSSTLVQRVTGTMKFVPPATTDFGPDGVQVTNPDAGGGNGIDVLGDTLAPGASDAEVSPVNRALQVVRAPGRFLGSFAAEMPAYAWLPIPLAIAGIRLFSLLFSTTPRRRENRVASAYRRIGSLSTDS